MLGAVPGIRKSSQQPREGTQVDQHTDMEAEVCARLRRVLSTPSLRGTCTSQGRPWHLS